MICLALTDFTFDPLVNAAFAGVATAEMELRTIKGRDLRLGNEGFWEVGLVEKRGLIKDGDDRAIVVGNVCLYVCIE